MSFAKENLVELCDFSLRISEAEISSKTFYFRLQWP